MKKRSAPQSASRSVGYITPSTLDAADRFGFRGYFYLPTITPADTMPSQTRRAVMEKSWWFYQNVGATAMVIEGLALDEVGTGLWPKWTSGVDEFDRAMTDAYHFTNHDPRFFSADGQSDCYTAQYNIRRIIRLYGDGFGQLLRPAPGSTVPLLSLLPGYIVDNTGKEERNSGWQDGVLRNALGRPIKFKVLNQEKGDIGREVEADDMLHFHDPFLPGQTRGMPALASVCKKLFRREDIEEAMSNGTLARELVGYAIEVKEDNPGPVFLPGASAVETQTNTDGSKYTVQKFFGDLAQRGVQIPELPGGSTLKTIETNRPGTAVREFLDSILREVAWSTGYPPEYVFYLAGMGQGTAVRLVTQKVRAVINSKREFQLKPQFLNRWHVFWAWQFIKSGRIANAPENWWKHKVIPPQDITVDIGREGRMFDERVATNRMSIEAYHGLSGEDAGDVEDENLAAIKRRCAKLNGLNSDPEVMKLGERFGYFDVWARSASANPVVTPEQTPVDPTEPNDPNNPPPPGNNGSARFALSSWLPDFPNE